MASRDWKPWTAEEEYAIYSAVQTKSSKQVAQELGRTPGAVRYKAWSLGVRFLLKGPRVWTTEAVAFMRENAQKMSSSEMAAHFNSTKDSVLKAAQLNNISLQKLRLWTPEEDAYIDKYYLVKPHHEIAAAIGRTPGAVAQRLKRIGIMIGNVPQAEWEAQFREAYSQQMSDVDIGKMLGISRSSARWRRIKLGLPAATKAFPDFADRIRAECKKRLKARMASDGATHLGQYRGFKERSALLRSGWPMAATKTEVKILEIIERSQRSTRFEIADELGMSRAGVYQIMRRMEVRGVLRAVGFRVNRDKNTREKLLSLGEGVFRQVVSTTFVNRREPDDAETPKRKRVRRQSKGKGQEGSAHLGSSGECAGSVRGVTEVCSELPRGVQEREAWQHDASQDAGINPPADATAVCAEGQPC